MSKAWFCLLSILKKEVNRTPREGKVVADLKEKIMCKVEVAGGEA